MGAAAPQIGEYKAPIVDQSGASRPLNSQFGNKFRVEVTVVDVTGPPIKRVSCAVNVLVNGSEKRLSRSTISMRKSDGLWVGSKTSTGLKPGSYNAVMPCAVGQSNLTRESVFTITDSPARVVAGLSACSRADGEFFRPVGVDFVYGGQVRKVQLRPASERGVIGYLSKFTFDACTTSSITALLKCGGIASNPAHVSTYDDVLIPPGDINLFDTVE